MGPYTKNPGQYAHALSDYAQSQGWTNLWQDMKQAWSANNNNATMPNSSNPANLSGAYAGCPTAVKALFLTPGSLLDHLQAQFGGVSTDYIELLRGMLGDIVFTTDQNGMVDANPVPPCYYNFNKNVDNFLAGNAEGEASPSSTGAPGTCAPLTDVNANLQEWASGIMTGIATQMADSEPLSASQQAFLKEMPIPMDLIMKYAVSTGQIVPMTSEFAGVAAKAYAFSMMADLDHNADVLMGKALIVARSNPGAVLNSPSAQCMSKLNQPVGMLKMYKKRVSQTRYALGQDYIKWATSLSSLETLGLRLQQFNGEAYKDLAEKFNPSVAGRAVGY